MLWTLCCLEDRAPPPQLRMQKQVSSTPCGAWGGRGGGPSWEAGVGGGGRLPTSNTSLQVALVEVEEGSDGFSCRGGWRARRRPPGPISQDDAGEEDQEGQRSIISLHFLIGQDNPGTYSVG